MPRFRQDNTQGYTDAELAELNAEYEEALRPHEEQWRSGRWMPGVDLNGFPLDYSGFPEFLAQQIQMRFDWHKQRKDALGAAIGAGKLLCPVCRGEGRTPRWDPINGRPVTYSSGKPVMGKCTTCQGTGQVKEAGYDVRACSGCRGSGEVLIPSHYPSGMQKRGKCEKCGGSGTERY
jgi:hypothetical protein